MSFASLPFVGLVATGVILYYLVQKKLQWVVLLLASMVFYLAGGVKSAAVSYTHLTLPTTRSV